MSYEQFYGEWELLAIRTDPRHPFSEANGVIFEIRRPGENKVVMIFENESDGYRSSATEPFVSNGPMYEIVDPNYIRVPVLVSELTDNNYTCDGLQMQDRRNGKVILRVGTQNSDDYYPSFVSEWSPQNIAGNESVS